MTQPKFSLSVIETTKSQDAHFDIASTYAAAFSVFAATKSISTPACQEYFLRPIRMGGGTRLARYSLRR